METIATIPTKKLLMKWRIAINIQCNFCGQDEDYLHYFYVLSVSERILGENTTNIEKI